MTVDYKGMTKIPIKNKEILEILDRFRQVKDREGFMENMRAVCDTEANRRDWWCGEEYLKHLQDMGHRHDGYPEACRSYDFKIREPEKSTFGEHSTAAWRADMIRELGELNEELQGIIAAKWNALCTIYPPGGFISWHNNANAHAYNIVFTWSETGDSFWEHLDPKTGEIVRIQDEPGVWTCKAGYFGHYGEPENVLYHKAETNCWRMTVSYMYNVDEASRFLRDSALDEIMSE